MLTVNLKITASELFDEVSINIPANVDDQRAGAIEAKLITDARTSFGFEKNITLIAAAIIRMLRMHPERSMMKAKMADHLSQQLIEKASAPKITEDELPALINGALPKIFIEFYA